MKGKSNSWTLREVGKNGVIMEVNDSGEITGKYNAQFLETTTIHMKPDGTMTWNQNIGLLLRGVQGGV